MPKYDYECEDGHLIETIAGYDDKVIPCKHPLLLLYTPTILKGKRPSHIPCGKPAKRKAVYRSQGVIFKGEGFTKSVVAPPPPDPRSTQGLTSDEAVEVWDDIAKEQHKYNTTDRQYLYEEERKFAKEEGVSIEQAAEAAAEGKPIPAKAKERATKARRKLKRHRGGKS